MPFRSTLPDLEMPEDVDFSTFVLARGRQTPEKTALVDIETGARIAYGELIGAIDAGAERLRAHGLQPGDMVAICGFNTPSFAVAAHAVWRAGAVVVTMNPLFTVREMQQELTDAGARYAIAAPGPIVFEGALLNFKRTTPAQVDFGKTDRGPLLFIAGGRDHTMPASVNRANARKYTSGVIAFREFPDRDHFTLGEPGWEDVATAALDWANEPRPSAVA